MFTGRLWFPFHEILNEIHGLFNYAFCFPKSDPKILSQEFHSDLSIERLVHTMIAWSHLEIKTTRILSLLQNDAGVHLVNIHLLTINIPNLSE